MEKWLEVLGIIELVIGLLVLVFLAYVTWVIVNFRFNEFNRYWKSRTLICASAIVWVVFLLLGNEYLWNSTEGIFNIRSKYSNAICALHVFFTVGSSEPLFFLIFLFIIKSKTSDKNQTLYIEDPNKYVYTRALLWTIPLIVIHIVILILDASSISEPRKLFWTVYDKEGSKCAVPIISTACFAIFFVIFLFFFTLLSRTFSRTVINRILIGRLRLLQFAFIAFLPLEVAIRVVLIFTLNLGNTSIALFHAFFFVDIAVVLIAVLEFAFFPVSDELGYYFINFKTYRRLPNDEDRDTKAITLSTLSPTNNGSSVNNDASSNNIGITSSQQQQQQQSNNLIPISEYEKTIKSNTTPNQKQSLFNPFDGESITIDDFDDDLDDLSKSKNNNIKINNNNIEMEKLQKKHKSPVLDRVRDTEPMNVPPLPLSSPMSSASSSPQSLSPVVVNHERKKSRKFSFSSSKRKSQQVNSQAVSPSSSSPSSGSPPNNNNNRSIYLPQNQVSHIETFKDQLYKYSQNKRF
ncbi:hypothetical protein DLAC_11394 [Tieghemostelium lacteum]|uniref:Uncharacterized protein n=1 Tax=Tieghemostelium lacteum TaxID=361077 RepID=A0A151Z2W0_TIELA|nr:hypothetical protein DLAC_11394 [Tieghemostelium lacteum]|eukprot:KYQ88144.1 hypothetical protein DLAC_11394 [Tieghemostelium lacteum]